MTGFDFLQMEGKRIVVTGASSGIGRETAIRASRHGATLALVARNPDALEDVRAALDGSSHVTVPYDLADVEGIPAMIRGISEQVGPLNGLVHAAGVHSTAPLKAVQVSGIRDLFNVNVTAAVMLAKGLRHKQVRGEQASIVLLSSAVGLVGQAGVSTYSASKGAIVSLTKSLALELAREHVRVNCLCPGVVRTAMTDTLKTSIGSSAFDDIVRAHPLGLGEASDVADAALYLLSAASKWVTGSAISIDGGYTAQ